jgi:hypothetical protein
MDWYNALLLRFIPHEDKLPFRVVNLPLAYNVACQQSTKVQVADYNLKRTETFLQSLKAESFNPMKSLEAGG